MGKCDFKVSISPVEALSFVRDNEDAELVHEETHDLGDGRYIGTLIFEKYFMRVSSRVALAVIADNINGVTGIRAISTGSSQGLFLNFDWGASDDFAYSVKEILDKYIIE